jgi:hypothetical protein
MENASARFQGAFVKKMMRTSCVDFVSALVLITPIKVVSISLFRQSRCSCGGIDQPLCRGLKTRGSPKLSR